MKAEYINPFIDSVYQLFDTMLGCEVRRGQLAVADKVNPTNITAIIGLTGSAQGAVALTFPVKTALSMVQKLLGMDIKVVDETVIDGMAEMVNIVAGGAKSRFSEMAGEPIDLSLPTVIRGDGFKVEHPSGVRWIEVPFDSDLGPFNMRVTFAVKSK